MRANSRVVKTTSVSWSPEALMYLSRRISNFFAVQGMMDVMWTVWKSILFLSAQYVFARTESICCGDFAVEKLSTKSGAYFSIQSVHAGQQDVMSGSLPMPFVKRLTNSVPSSMMVTSAEKFVSKTFLKPRRLKAA